jgi:multidrug efflux pump subunit AcrA (membrane-fusion protein)
MTANVRILGEKVEKVLTVPVEAIFHKDDKDVVYVLKKGAPSKGDVAPKTPAQEAWKQWFAEREVQVGLASLTRIQVLSGLQEGEEVALEDPTRPKKKEA